MRDVILPFDWEPNSKCERLKSADAVCALAKTPRVTNLTAALAISTWKRDLGGLFESFCGLSDKWVLSVLRLSKLNRRVFHRHYGPLGL